MIDVIVPWTKRTDTCIKSISHVVNRLKTLKGVGKVIVVESGKVINGFPKNVTYDYHKLQGEANLSWAGNYGFRKSTTDIVALLNSSLMIPLDTFVHTIGMHALGCKAGSLVSGFGDLTPEQTDIVFDTPPVLKLTAYPIPKATRGGKFSGGFWMTRELWTECRGMNEAYYPSGFEDYDMERRLNVLIDINKEWGTSLPIPAIHLYHDPHYHLWRQSRPLHDYVEKLSDLEIPDYIKSMPTDFGNPDGPQYFWPESLEKNRSVIPDKYQGKV